MPKKRKKVMVNILNEGTTAAGLESRLLQDMQAKTADYDFHLFFPTGRPIPDNRHRVVKQFLEGDYDFLFMFDDDNMPATENNVFDFLDLNLPVVGGVYPGRNKTGIHFHVYKFTSLEPVKAAQYTDPKERKGLQKVDAVATGAICIRRDVLEKLPKRSFDELFDEDGLIILGDDMHFCYECKKAGIDIYAHWDHVFFHFKTVDLLQMGEFVYNAREEGIKAGIAIAEEKFNLPKIHK